MLSMARALPGVLRVNIGKQAWVRLSLVRAGSSGAFDFGVEISYPTDWIAG